MSRFALSSPPPPPTWLYLWSVFGLSLTVLLALEWLWRTIWTLVEQHRPLGSPATFARLITTAIMIAVLISVTPDLWLLITAKHLALDQQMLIARVDRFLDGVVPLPFIAAWLLDFAGARTITGQLRRAPIPVPRWPHRNDVGRLVSILGCVFVIAAALTFAP